MPAVAFLQGGSATRHIQQIAEQEVANNYKQSSCCASKGAQQRSAEGNALWR